MSAKILLFSAPWCVPCTQLKPLFLAIAAQFPEVPFEILDVEQSPEKAAEHNVRAVPTIILIKDDGESRRLGGGQSKVSVETLFMEAGE